MNIIGLLLGNFLLFTLYPCTPSLFKPTAKIAYSLWIFAEILERCMWPMSKSANKSRKWKKSHFANIITGIYFKNSKRENGKETYSISMVGKKNPIKWCSTEHQNILKYKSGKKAPKKKREKKQGKKRLTLGFTLVLNISPVLWHLFLFWSSHKSSENRDTEDVRYQYDVRSMLRNMDYK